MAVWDFLYYNKPDIGVTRLTNADKQKARTWFLHITATFKKLKIFGSTAFVMMPILAVF